MMSTHETVTLHWPAGPKAIALDSATASAPSTAKLALRVALGISHVWQRARRWFA